MLSLKVNEKENKITATINPLLYPIEAIYGAAYVFLDRAYLFLDGDPKKSVVVDMKGKEKMSKKQLENLAGEFYNEIVNYALRNKISRNNQKIREYIVARALSITPSPTPKANKPQEQPKGWQEDKLGLALSWEEKYGKTHEKRKKGSSCY